MFTLTERERQAYAAGNIELAELIACVIDADAENALLMGYLRDAVDHMTDAQREEFHRCNPKARETIE
jgi:hypothetical protein